LSVLLTGQIDGKTPHSGQVGDRHLGPWLRYRDELQLPALGTEVQRIIRKCEIAIAIEQRWASFKTNKKVLNVAGPGIGFARSGSVIWP
jgi:hypothetical protein